MIVLTACKGSHCQCYRITYLNGNEIDVEYYTEEDDNGCRIYNDTITYTHNGKKQVDIIECSYN